MRLSTRSALFFLGLVGCSQSSVPTYDSGLPPSTPITDLTDAQAQQACQRAEALLNQLVGPDAQQHLACVLGGILTQATGGASCTTTYAQCMNQPTNATPIDLMCANVTAPTASGCTATVAEVEACSNARIAQFDALYAQVNCSLASNPTALSNLQDQLGTVDATLPAACAALQATCPQYFGSLGGTVTGP